MRRTKVLLLLAAMAALPAPGSAQETATGLLARQLTPILQARHWRRATWGALVVSLTRGDTLFSWNADRRFVPASNAKLFTTAAALHYLGPDYRFPTVLFADGPVSNGELYGDLVLYGTGDPTFALDTAGLAPFADSVVRAGIRRVRGDIVGDASFLGAELAGPGWSPDNLDDAYSAPSSALGAAENHIRVTVEPGPSIGAPATFWLDPPGDYYRITNHVVTARPHTRTRIEVHEGRTRGAVELTGAINIARGSWSTFLVVREPALFAAGMLRQLLEARSVRITGATRAETGEAPERSRQVLDHVGRARDDFAGAIAVRRSAPLDQIVSMINHRSHNLSAELALRSIGRVRGNSGTFASGARLVQRYLVQDVGVSSDAVQVTDGSGLSVLDLATPRSLVQLLAHERGDNAFYRSLPMVGQGLRDRMVRTAALGRLRAKTGTLVGVSALSGYVTTADGEELAFSLIVNSTPSVARARTVQDQIGARLASYSRELPRQHASRN
ncbi:MAG: D-alanyl-D-alanine carboxypeptidase/D-alanyl-D-alanine-endopeptidase [Gemmatimonadales bacterium]